MEFSGGSCLSGAVLDALAHADETGPWGDCSEHAKRIEVASGIIRIARSDPHWQP